VTTELHDAWNELHEATPTGWHVERPRYHRESREWVQYAFDPSERPVVGLRSRERTARAESEVDVVTEMTRCLRKLGEGRGRHD